MGKLINIIARFTFGTILIVFGLNQFFHFIRLDNYSTEALYLIQAFQQSNYILYSVGIIQIILGIALFINKRILLGLILFAPILLNILLFHFFNDLFGLIKVLPTFLLYSYFVFYYRKVIKNIFKQLDI